MTPLIPIGIVGVAWLLSRRGKASGPSATEQDPYTGVDKDQAAQDMQTTLDKNRYAGGLGNYFNRQAEGMVSGAAVGAGIGGPLGAVIGGFVGGIIATVAFFVNQPPDDYGVAVRGVIGKEIRKRNEAAARMTPPMPQVPINEATKDYLAFYIMTTSKAASSLWAHKTLGQLAMRIEARNTTVREATATTPGAVKYSSAYGDSWTVRVPGLRNTAFVYRDGPSDSGDTASVMFSTYFPCYFSPYESEKHADSTVSRTSMKLGGGRRKYYDKIAAHPIGTIFPLVVMKGPGDGKTLEDTYWSEANTLYMRSTPVKHPADWERLDPQNVPQVNRVLKYWASHTGIPVEGAT